MKEIYHFNALNETLSLTLIREVVKNIENKEGFTVQLHPVQYMIYECLGHQVSVIKKYVLKSNEELVFNNTLTIFGMKVKLDYKLPKNEIKFVDKNNKTLYIIQNLEIPKVWK